MTWMSPHAFAISRGVPPRTVNNAVAAKLITVNHRGLLDAEAVDAGWLADHLARAARLKSTEASRSRRRDAAALAAATSINTLRRQLRELQETTVNKAAVDAAHARRLARLQAALHAFPALYTADTAKALQRPETAVRAALTRFAERLIADLALPPPYHG